MELFKEVNILSSQINDLMIKNRVNIFLEGYNYSKTFDEIKNHLFHIKRVGRVDISTLVELKNKLLVIPNKFAFQRDELLKEINFFLTKFSEHNEKIIKERKIENNFQKIPNEELSKIKEEVIESEEEIVETQPTEKEIVIEKEPEKKSQPKNNLNNNLKKIEIEVDKYFKIIVDSKNVSQVKIAYKKILFYIDILSISKEKKQILKNKVNSILKEKKFT